MNSLAVRLSKRLREGNYRPSVSELAEVLQQTPAVISFYQPESDTIWHIRATTNTDYMPTIKDEPPGLPEGIMWVYDIYQESWVEIPADKVLSLYIISEENYETE